jgi:hypothetical protein
VLTVQNENSNFTCVAPRQIQYKLALFAGQWLGSGDRASAVKTEAVTSEEEAKLLSSFDRVERQILLIMKKHYGDWTVLFHTVLGLENNMTILNFYQAKYPKRHAIWRQYFGLPLLDPDLASDRVLLNLCYLWDEFQSKKDGNYAKSVQYRLFSRWKILTKCLRWRHSGAPPQYPVILRVGLDELVKKMYPQGGFYAWSQEHVTPDIFHSFIARHYRIGIPLVDNRTMEISLVSLTLPECERVGKAVRRSIRFWFDMYSKGESLEDFMEAE